MINFTKGILLILAFCTFNVATAQVANLNVKVNSPDNITGDYDGYLALFGVTDCDFSTVTGDLVLATDSQNSSRVCSPPITEDLSGAIAVIDRGDCSFVEKAEAAQAKGAIAVMICNNDDELGNPGGESDDVDIPVFMVSTADCDLFKANIDDINITLDLSGSSFEDPFADDNVIWGANGEGSFENGLGDWTTEGLSNSTDLWQWTATGDAAFSLNGVITSPIQSKSTCGGAAIFDLIRFQDSLFDIATVEPPYTRFESELISPTMNLSGVNAVALKFRQVNFPLNRVSASVSSTQVAFSTDGGTTWSDPINVETENNQDNDEIFTEIERIPLPDLAGASNAKVKFIINGDFYWWTIDDVEMVELVGSNISMSDAFYTPLSYAFPQSHADADTFFFVSSIRNTGAQNLAQVRLDVEITNDATGASVFTDRGTQSDIAPGDVVDLATDNLFVPIDLPVGIYTIDYSLRALDVSETSTDDNTTSKKFEITEDLFSKEPGPTTGLRVGGEYAAAALYRTSKNVTDYVATNAIVSIAAADDVLTDNFVDIFLVRLKDGILEGGFEEFDFMDTDLSGHPSFDIISQNTHVFTDETSGALIEVPFSTSNQGVPLDPGAAYLVIVRFDATQAGSAATANSELFLGYNNTPDVSHSEFGGISDFVISKDQGQWFTGFNGDPAPVIRMQVALSSDTDDIPLPVGTVKAFPNPASEMLTTVLNFEESLDVTLILASLDGKIVKTRNLKNVSQRSIDFDVSNLTAGTYILKAYTEKGSSTNKIVVAK